ncbi:MAG: M20/M25/M40 family metallo-hydrolase, partial [Actinobacteria bacterium]|nr:M20/M25/M40 family metallo-hydrolase [Actinomycetota bacterium]
DGPTLCLLSHCDTVLANPDEWTHDPWCGEVIDGELWGRGALDMKSQTAAEVAAGIELANSGWRPANGDLLIVCVVDEETGGADGVAWLCENHPDLVRCDYSLNEGAGAFFELGGERLYGVCVAEKGVCRFTITTDGVAGHASNPRFGDNALLKLAPLITALGEWEPVYDLTDGASALMTDLGAPVEDGDVGAALDRLRQREPLLAAFVEPMLGLTFAPTVISASGKINVLPSQAKLRVDCRTPPGLGEALVRKRVAEVLGTEGYRLEFTEQAIGNGSAVDSPLMDLLSGWIAREDPGARTVPIVLPAFTDSRTIRATFPDSVSYGFFPMRHTSLAQMWPLIHAPDERIDVRDLAFAARCFSEIAQELLGSAS